MARHRTKRVPDRLGLDRLVGDQVFDQLGT